ncbi:hypothetical protein V5O48_014641 [Marasmius crinis-equi]|uniref:Carboxylesterase type B domain-containing protein n=1 Tax=Marasmius crinis-equi TaxID=585013 RepID=A0ABR3EWQ9_9AGAR
MESDGGLSLLSPRLTNEPWSNFVSAVAPCSHLSNTSNTLDCLRSDQVSSEDVLQALINAGISFSGLTPWAPLLDGTDGLIPRYPSQSSIKAKFPIIIGSCLDEGTILQSQAPPNTSSDDAIRNLIKSASSRPPGREKEIQQIIDRTLREYPNIPSLGSPFGTGNDTFGLDKGYKRGSAVGGDLILQSHRRFMSHRLAQRHDGNSTQAQVFSYLFAESNGGVLTVPPEFIIGSPVPGSLGVPHASEIFYVFGTLEDELGPGKVTTNALELSQTVMDYWISFAVSGNPNDGRGEARPHWAPYNPDDPMSIQLKGQDTRMISDTFRKQGMAVFNEDPTALRR